MRNITLAILAIAFAGFVTFSGSLVAMNHPSNATKTSAADQAELTLATGSLPAVMASRPD
jgi:hypothetical protein